MAAVKTYTFDLEFVASLVGVDIYDKLLEIKQQHSGFPMDTQRATSAPTFCLNYISQSP